MECNICFETKKSDPINCCKGKMWCKDCKIKITHKYNYYKCPFCCKKFKIQKREQQSKPDSGIRRTSDISVSSITYNSDGILYY